jgi:eukaryotic-like serine/threonine-protein kinase
MSAKPTLAFGPFTFDTHNRLLRSSDREIALPPRVLGVLELLIARPGEVVPRQDLMDGVWKEAFVTDTSLAEAVSVLRQALGDDPQTPTYIQTVHRRGYRFVAPIDETRPPVMPATATTPPSADVPGETRRSGISSAAIAWSVTVFAILLALAAVWNATHQKPPTPALARFRLDPAPGTLFDRRAQALALSPDGTAIVWSGCDGAGCRLYLRRLSSLDATAIAGTEDAAAPFFSPDGTWVGFFADGKLRKVALSGGVPIPLADAAQPLGGTWTGDGHIIFAASAFGGLMRVGDRGGEAAALTMPSATAGEIRHAWPSLLPGGRTLVFTVATSPLEGAPGRIVVSTLGAGPPTWQTLIEAGDVARGVTADYVAFTRGGELHAVAVDRNRMSIAGVEQVVASAAAPLQFAVSEGGSLVYAAPDAPASASALTWSAPAAAPASAAAALAAPSLSPDGRRLAGVGGDASSPDVWIAELDRGAATRLTYGTRNVLPVWTSDASVAYATSKNGPYEIWSRDTSGSSPAQLLLSAASRGRHVFPSSFTRDGVLMAFVESGGPTRGDIWTASGTGGSPSPVLQTAFDEISPALSPDGRLIAYQSDESGRWEISIVRLADRHRLSVSTGGGIEPHWSPDGRTLFYRAGSGLARVEIDPGGDRAGTPSIVRPLNGQVAGLSADGRVLLREQEPARLPHAVLTLEWVRELRQRLGIPSSPPPR